ncbi:MAG TPA: PhzF family phenazine biosynthesis protein [Micropepsaceae bacterium]|nr:PhzF family phenazine biosynthesis protein [Micropepsaceae bacterium]
MRLRLWQVDAFARHVFEGNQAAIVPLESWLADATMQAIAEENNLAETAFFVHRNGPDYDLRWFTPAVEVPMCGHATLASAWVIFSEIVPELAQVRFATKSGTLTVEKSADGHHRMALPAGVAEPLLVGGFGMSLGQALSVSPPEELYLAPTGAGGTRGVIAIWPESVLRDLKLSDALAPLLARAKAGGLLATAKSQSADYDFVSRFFAPGMGIAEDPVTGSMHATLAPFWAARLGKPELRAYQASPRGGTLRCKVENTHVTLSGPCVLYLKGEIEI